VLGSAAGLLAIPRYLSMETVDFTALKDKEVATTVRRRFASCRLVRLWVECSRQPRGSRPSSRKSIRRYLISIRPRPSGGGDGRGAAAGRRRGVVMVSRGHRAPVRPPAHTRRRRPPLPVRRPKNIRCVGEGDSLRPRRLPVAASR